MSDRELLELAAKAAGMANNGFTSGRGLHVSGEPEYDGGWWNPLADDGDALRLAVKLNLLHTYHIDSPVWLLHFDATDPDKDAATRRAIVRAAAELGRSMP